VGKSSGFRSTTRSVRSLPYPRPPRQLRIFPLPRRLVRQSPLESLKAGLPLIGHVGASWSHLSLAPVDSGLSRGVGDLRQPSLRGCSTGKLKPTSRLTMLGAEVLLLAPSAVSCLLALIRCWHRFGLAAAHGGPEWAAHLTLLDIGVWSYAGLVLPLLPASVLMNSDPVTRSTWLTVTLSRPRFPSASSPSFFRASTYRPNSSASWPRTPRSTPWRRRVPISRYIFRCARLHQHIGGAEFPSTCANTSMSTSRT